MRHHAPTSLTTTARLRPGRLASLLLLGGALALPLAGQAQGLGLLEAYHQALEADPELAAARAAREAGEERIVQGRSELLPRVNLQASHMEHDTEVFDTQQESFGDTRSTDYGSQTWGVELRQPLFRLQSLAAYRAGKAETQRVEHIYSQAEQQAILRLTERYFAVLSASEALAAAQAEFEAMERRMEAARQGREVGISSRTELEEAVARRDQAEATLIMADNRFELSKQELAALLGTMPIALYRVAGVPEARPMQPDTFEAWEERALANSPALAEARQLVELARADITQRQGARLPSVDLVARYSDQSGGAQGGDDYFARNTVYGIELSMPLFAGGALSSRVSEARATARETEHRLEQVQRGVALEARRGFLNAVAARSRLEATARAVESAGTAREAIRQGYRNGLNSQVELLDAEQRYFAMQRDLAETKYGYLASLLRLQAAVGDLGEDDIADLAPLFDDPLILR